MLGEKNGVHDFLESNVHGASGKLYFTTCVKIVL